MLKKIHIKKKKETKVSYVTEHYAEIPKEVFENWFDGS